MSEADAAGQPDRSAWSTGTGFDEFTPCCDRPHIRLLTDPESLSLAHRFSHIGPLAIGELTLGSEMSIECDEMCGAYRLAVMRSGYVESEYRRASIISGAGSVILHPVQGSLSARYSAGSETLAVTIDRSVVDNALSDVLGRQVAAQINLQPPVHAATSTVRDWLGMLFALTDQLFRPGSLLTNPMVGLPYVDSLVRGFLLVADHPHRDAFAAEPKTIAPRNVRAAIEIIEAEAHLPLTMPVLAARTHVSVRCLQQGFRHYLGTSPMAYLREVRLKRAHQMLRKSDPSSATVASIAYQWGFTNLGRFAATHAARYGDTPAVTLRRSS